MTTRYKTVKYKNIKVSHLPELDGGGDDFGQEFLHVMEDKIGKVDHLFEYCAGPGYIGFSLLAHGYCNKLTLADINPVAVEACQDTIRRNGLEDRVKVYLSDALDDIPQNEKWDVIVGNPPMIFADSELHKKQIQEKDTSHLRRYDHEFIVHKKFYRDIHRFLKPEGTAILQESDAYTKAKDFMPMIKENGVELIEVFKARPLSFFECIFKTRFRTNIRTILRGKNKSPFFVFKKMKTSTVYYMWTRVSN